MYGYIYFTENLLDYKCYIGQHHNDGFDNKYIGSGKYIKQAIKKYGKENFICIMLEQCKTKKELDDREEYWIKKLNAVNLDCFYNINPRASTPGEEARKIMSYKAKIRPHPPTTKDFIWITNGDIDKLINKTDINIFPDWTRGRCYIKGKQNWAKGLTKETNESLMKVSIWRKNALKSGNCYKWPSGKDNPNHDEDKMNRIKQDNFLNQYKEFGKCYMCSKYKISTLTFEKLCDELNISKELRKEIHHNTLCKSRNNRKCN